MLWYKVLGNPMTPGAPDFRGIRSKYECILLHIEHGTKGSLDVMSAFYLVNKNISLQKGKAREETRNNFKLTQFLAMDMFNILAWVI